MAKGNSIRQWPSRGGQLSRMPLLLLLLLLPTHTSTTKKLPRIVRLVEWTTRMEVLLTHSHWLLGYSGQCGSHVRVLVLVPVLVGQHSSSSAAWAHCNGAIDRRRRRRCQLIALSFAFSPWLLLASEIIDRTETMMTAKSRALPERERARATWLVDYQRLAGAAGSPTLSFLQIFLHSAGTEAASSAWSGAWSNWTQSPLSGSCSLFFSLSELDT